MARLDSRGLRSPLCLSKVPFGQLIAAPWDLPHPDMLIWVWQAARTDHEPSRTALPRSAYTPPSDFQELICSLRADSIQDTGIGRDYTDLRRDLSLPVGFDNLSTAAKYSALSNSGADSSRILKFLSLAAQRNTIRAFAGSLRPAASGMQNYKNFCEYIGRPALPVQSDTVLLWSGLFRPGRTYSQYLAHVMKASILLRHPTDWITPDVRSVAKGLANAQDLSFKFQNYMFAADLLRLITSVKLDNEFGLACFMSFLLLLRVPSETLLMRKADNSDFSTEFPPQDQKILVGVRMVAGRPLFIAKFSWRKNLKHGCILRRPCLCDESSNLTRLLCPVHKLWPRMSRNIPVRGLIFPSLTASSFGRKLKSEMVRMGRKSGDSFFLSLFSTGGHPGATGF